MTDERRRRHTLLADWFEQASAMEGAALDAFLARCRDEDHGLHAELCELLDVDTRDGGALDAGLDAALASEAAAAMEAARAPGQDADLAEGDRIGDYVIERPLGAGGFALVYEAKQREPVTRDVALKVLRPGMDSRQVLTRFAAELQAQARMNHEHVARVLDAGTTEDGRPFLAMELVDGQTITRWCEVRRLGLRARLELFVQACDAVQHAHQKGVIHRDIKPSNVLVAEGGTHGRVKIIDFGIAKAIEGSLTDDTLRTQEGQLVGTPEYMSPEQAGRDGDDLDTRTDVYSLGVLLYELTSGARPFDFAGRSLLEIQRTIHEVDPPRPSQRLDAGQLGGALDGPWERALRSDLDWVVLRAMEKDPGRRYGAVAALAADVQRFLDHEPVEASPPSRTYRVAKFVRRHRAGVVSAALVALSMVAGTAWALVERDRADAARAEAVARAAESNKVSLFQQEQLAGLDPARVGAEIRRRLLDEAAAAQARDMGVAEDDPSVSERVARLEEELRGANFTNVAMATVDDTFLAGIVERVDERFADEPRVRARILYGITTAQDDLGLTEAAVATGERAVQAAEEAFGARDIETSNARIALAHARYIGGDFTGAARDYDALLEAMEGVEASVEPGANRALISAMRGRAAVLDATGDREASLEMRRAAHARAEETFGPKDRVTLDAWYEVARVLPDPDEREAAFLEAIERSREIHGPEHPSTLRMEENYARLIAMRGRTREAREIRERTLPLLRTALGDRHRSTLRSIESLGLMKHFAADNEGAEVLIRQAWEGRVEAYGPDAIDTIGTAGNLAMVLGLIGRAEEAIELYETVLPAQRAALGLEHQDTLGTMTNLGMAYNELGRFEDAVEVLTLSLEVKRRVLGMEHGFTRAALQALATAYRGVERWEEARALEAEFLEHLAEVARRPDATADVLGTAAERILTTGYKSLRDVPLGLEFAERAVALEKEHGGAMLHIQHSRVGLAHWYAGDMTKAVAAQREALRTAPERDRPRMQVMLDGYIQRQESESRAAGEEEEDAR